MIPLTYQEEYSKKSFPDLIRAFGDWVSETELKLDKKAGTGTIQVLDIEEGLQLRIWDCMLSTELNINREACTGAADKSFTLVYYITPGTFLIEDTNSASTISTLWNTVFMTNDAEFRVKILPHKPLQCLSLNFTPEWLQKNILADADFQDHSFQQQVMNTQPFLLFESVSHNEELVIGNLFQNKYHQSFGKFFFRSKALNLLTEFFLKIRGRLSAQPGNSIYHGEQINEAEKKLMDNLDSDLPNLKMGGKNIYDYFLEKRMMLARKLLDAGKNSVTEIAYSLGYEKVSNPPSKYTFFCIGWQRSLVAKSNGNFFNSTSSPFS